MHVVAFNGSARKDGNTAIMIEWAAAELRNAEISVEVVQLAGLALTGCRACGACFRNRDHRCVVASDPLNEFIARMHAADGIILASPTYYADVTTNMKALMERAGYVARANDDMLQRKVGAAIVAVRRGGAIHAFDTLNHFFFINQMVVPGSSYWNMGIGLEIGTVERDEEGQRTMRVLGRNMAWVLQKLRG